MKADLHLHTHYSDGVVSPAELVRLAAGHGLTLIALADHDSMGGWPEADATGQTLGVTVLPAAEFTATLHGQEIHLLGYFPAMPDAGVAEHLVRMQEFRRERIRTAVDRLRQRGWSLSFDEISFAPSCESLTGAHLARLLLEKGAARSMRGVWRRKAVRDALMGFEVTAEEVIGIIHRGGGLAVWAHPAERRFRRRLQELAARGLDGVEVVNFRRAGRGLRKMQSEADELGLVSTGGSDWHEGPGLGKTFLEEGFLARFLDRLGFDRHSAAEEQVSARR